MCTGCSLFENVRRLRYLLFVAALLVMLSFSAAGKAYAFEVPLKESEIKNSYDLIVVGSDPEGIAAAVSGARNGLSTLLVDTRPELGGLMTRGWLNSIDMNYGPNREILNQGIFVEFYNMVRGDSFDVEEAKAVFNILVNSEDNLDVLLDVQKISPVKGQVKEKSGIVYDAVTGVKVIQSKNKEREIRARRVIDATQDADLAAEAGVPYSLGQEDFGRSGHSMAVTLVFKLDNVSDENWDEIRRILQQDGNPETGANNVSAWGFGDKMFAYQPTNPRVKIRGLNLGRQRDGSVLVNALQVFGVDPMNPDSREDALKLAVEELPHIMDYIHKNIWDLRTTTLGGVAPELYIRETRHIYGEYRLTIDDVLENRDFWDRVAFGSYPVDIQATNPKSQGAVVGKPIKYAIPYRSLVPKKVENLLVVGRSASFDSLPHGSARVIPVGMATGQAAGAAAALSLERGKTFRQMGQAREDIATLQARLTVQGMDLSRYEFHSVGMDEQAYDAVVFLRRMGLIKGGYRNDYLLDEPMPEVKFLETLSEAAKQTGAKIKRSPDIKPYDEELQVSDVALVLSNCLGNGKARYDAYRDLKDAPFWNSQVELDDPDAVVNTGAAYMIIKDFLDYVGYEKKG